MIFGLSAEQFKAMKCIFCENDLTPDTKAEHILLNALGGRKKTRKVDCTACNGLFGSTIDKEVAEQVVVIRNMLHLDSGTGQLPPMLKDIQAGKDVIRLSKAGQPELVAKPFKIDKREDGSFDLRVVGKSPEDIVRHIPNIAAQLGCSEEQVLEILKSATATYTAKRPDAVHYNLSFGGPFAIRSFTKSALVLWALLVGNGHVKSAPYDDVRRFVLEGDDTFDQARIRMDSRHLPHVAVLSSSFGKFFNLIYVKSDASGRVIAHFTLYNLVAWQIVLAESGGAPNMQTALVSNPLNPTEWSDKIADEIDLDFIWLMAPSHDLTLAKERLDAIGRHHFETDGPRELHRIAGEVFAKYGITDFNAPITDAELLNKIIFEISRRFASHALHLPHVETLTGADIVALLREALGRSS
jgi:hypothetical protein